MTLVNIFQAQGPAGLLAALGGQTAHPVADLHAAAGALLSEGVVEPAEFLSPLGGEVDDVALRGQLLAVATRLAEIEAAKCARPCVASFENSARRVLGSAGFGICIGKDSIRSIVERKDYDPNDLMNLLSKNPELNFLYKSQHPIWEGGTMDEHHMSVALTFERLVAERGHLGSGFEKFLPALRFVIIIHDIGKPLGRKDQHKHTREIMERKFREWGIDEGWRNFIFEVLPGNPLGSLIFGSGDAAPDLTLADFEARAAKAGSNLATFAAAYCLYWIADSSAYHIIKASLHHEDESGRLLIKRDWKSIAELFSMFHSRTNGGFDPAMFMTAAPVDKPGFLPAEVERVRWLRRRERIKIVVFAGDEFRDAGEAKTELISKGKDVRIGVDATKLSAEHLGGVEEEILKRISGVDKKKVVLVICATDHNVLNDLVTFASGHGIAVMAIIPSDMLDPAHGHAIRQADYWFIENDNDVARMKLFLSDVGTVTISSKSGIK